MFRDYAECITQYYFINLSAQYWILYIILCQKRSVVHTLIVMSVKMSLCAVTHGNISSVSGKD